MFNFFLFFFFSSSGQQRVPTWHRPDSTASPAARSKPLSGVGSKFGKETDCLTVEQTLKYLVFWAWYTHGSFFLPGDLFCSRGSLVDCGALALWLKITETQKCEINQYNQAKTLPCAGAGLSIFSICNVGRIYAWRFFVKDPMQKKYNNNNNLGKWQIGFAWVICR